MKREEAELHFKEASRLFAAGRVREARAILERLAVAFPDNAQVRAALEKCRAAESVKLTVKSRLPLVLGVVAALAIVAGAAYWLGSRRPVPSDSPIVLSTDSDSVAAASPTLPAPPVGSDYAWLADLKPNWTWEAGPGSAPDFSERVKKGMYDPLLGLDMESMVVPDAAYPDGKATIWIPKERARQRYLAKTTFIPTPAYKTVPIAKPGDVNKDKSKYGYWYVTGRFPSHVPQYDYSRWNEEPIYPFIGQKVPGTDDVLVDITPDNKVVPALITLDHRIFRSINWPRERYIAAVERIRASKQDYHLSGQQKAPQSQLNGVVYVSGDYNLADNQSLSIAAGTLFGIAANSDDSHVGEGENQIQFRFDGRVEVQGTEIDPVIFTTDIGSTGNSRGQDWLGINLESHVQTNIHYAIVEYARLSIAAYSCMQRLSIDHNIVRLDFAKERDFSFAIRTQMCSSNVISRNEIHNSNTGIGVDHGTDEITDNLVYLPKEDSVKKVTDAIHSMNARIAIRNNVLSDTTWGIEIGLNSPRVVQNVIMNNKVGIMFFLRDGPQSPSIEDSNVWNNSPYNYACEKNPGKWELTELKSGNNLCEDPRFVNTLIRDYRSVTE